MVESESGAAKKWRTLGASHSGNNFADGPAPPCIPTPSSTSECGAIEVPAYVVSVLTAKAGKRVPECTNFSIHRMQQTADAADSWHTHIQCTAQNRTVDVPMLEPAPESVPAWCSL